MGWDGRFIRIADCTGLGVIATLCRLSGAHSYQHRSGEGSGPNALRVHLSRPHGGILLAVYQTGTGKSVARGSIMASDGILRTYYPLTVAWEPADPIPKWISHTVSSSRAFIRAVLGVYGLMECEISASMDSGRVVHEVRVIDGDWERWLERELAAWARHEREIPPVESAAGKRAFDAVLERVAAGQTGDSRYPGNRPLPRRVGASDPQGRAGKAGRGKAPQEETEAAVPTEPIPEVQVLWEPMSLRMRVGEGIELDSRRWQLQEQATCWWVSNQTDELICLPHCNVERLEYQTRAALRVIGALRGRALLSDEVGLGKTIEAGLVLKEYLVRGMVKRFLVLTQPSLVDQWAEELASKFGIPVATTHDAACRSDPAAFWSGQKAVVASLPLVRQPGHRPHAQAVPWDLLIVDEAHHLRNRTSLSWETVSQLPRRYMLLLTATPVQNSLEELYNLVTLLQPGQLASPKEFRARYMDPKKPRQPKESEELRRLLGQVMIRNTRANSGVHLPPRRAETALFTPDPAEASVLEEWEGELRTSMTRLSGSQASLWGRLLLQAAGSSPAALLAALKSYPERAEAAAWSKRLECSASWNRKCGLLPPIAAGEGGVVVFTQFLATQQALAEQLMAAHVPVILMNGSTPAAQRQPMIEEFRRRGGALLLTQSGTEGRNLQFCHRMVNFDLPWNPMEIEQRIGRLHRMGQRHPVRIHNFVQAGTLQEKLLNLLQEKLNLFELVVGEAGLVLGDRFGEDDFAEEILRRWREGEGRLEESLADLGEQLTQARADYRQVQELDSTLFAQDYASL